MTVLFNHSTGGFLFGYSGFIPTFPTYRTSKLLLNISRATLCAKVLAKQPELTFDDYGCADAHEKGLLVSATKRFCRVVLRLPLKIHHCPKESRFSGFPRSVSVCCCESSWVTIH